MKKILFSLMALFCCMSMNAQKIIVYQGGQEYASYEVDEVDSIVYKTITESGGDAASDSGLCDWTVMFYSVGGGNLDTAQVQNISQAMRSTVNAKINMTFEFKFSTALQSKVADNQKGTFFFDMAAVRSKLGSDASTYDDGGSWMANISTEQIGDESYDMSKASNLTAFINKSKALHPANHYMLILSDHGSGWNALKDNVVNAAKGSSLTGILADDNNNTEMSAASVEQAIKNSDIQKVDVIYCDACLMATAENLYQYSSVSKYFVGAVELTPGMGGEYSKLLNYIGDNSDPWTWGQNYVNYLTSAQHWGQSDDSKIADLGIYNLTSMCNQGSDITTAIANFASQLNTDLADASNAQKINSAVINTQIAQADNYGGVEYTENTLPGLSGDGENGKLTIQALRNYYNNNKDKFVSTYKANPSTINQLLTDAVANGACGLILADFMDHVVNNFGTSSVYNDYYQAYLTALKSCAYIRSALKPSDADFAYKHVSMSVNIYGMNDVALKSWNTNQVTWIDSNGDIVGNESQMAGKSATELLNAYNSNTFDQQTNWSSNFLKNLTVNPGPFFNCSLESMNLQ